MMELNQSIYVTDPALAQQFITIRDNQTSVWNYLKAMFNVGAAKLAAFAIQRQGSAGINTITLQSEAAVTAGQLISISNGKVRPALLPTYPAHGYALENIPLSSIGRCVLWDGVITSSGLTTGAKYYCSNSVAGAITTTVNGNCIGVAMSATEILFHVQGF